MFGICSSKVEEERTDKQKLFLANLNLQSANPSDRAMPPFYYLNIKDEVGEFMYSAAQLNSIEHYYLSIKDSKYSKEDCIAAGAVECECCKGRGNFLRRVVESWQVGCEKCGGSGFKSASYHRKGCGLVWS